jgi:hypothetical protein
VPGAEAMKKSFSFYAVRVIAMFIPPVRKDRQDRPLTRLGPSQIFIYIEPPVLPKRRKLLQEPAIRRTTSHNIFTIVGCIPSRVRVLLGPSSQSHSAPLESPFLLYLSAFGRSCSPGLQFGFGVFVGLPSGTASLQRFPC